MLDAASEISALPQQELENNLTQLAAHINAATYRFLMLIAEFDRREAWGGDGASTNRWNAAGVSG